MFVNSLGLGKLTVLLDMVVVHFCHFNTCLSNNLNSFEDSVSINDIFLNILSDSIKNLFLRKIGFGNFHHFEK
jgi:hypothetical protein